MCIKFIVLKDLKKLKQCFKINFDISYVKLQYLINYSLKEKYS